MTSVSVVIPVYNAELSLNTLCEQLIPIMEGASDQFEVILVEDHGSDSSWGIICNLASQDPRVRGIQLSRNYGQHNALLCGIRAACYDTIVTMDDDLQNPVSEISLLLNKIDDGYDVVYGAPLIEQHGLFRNLASRMTKIALQGSMGVDTARNVSAFRAFRTKLRDGFKNYRSPFVSIDVLLTWSTSNFATVRVRHEPRYAGISNYTIRKLIHHAFNLMTGFSTLPLQMASLVGFLFTLFGFGILVWVLGRYFITGSSIPGFPFLASIIAIFSGAQLFALGIFGEYLARIHFRTMDRPAYVVGQICECHEDSSIQSADKTTVLDIDIE
ncbi:MAG: glycosyltransferase family 2 protein [Candidatus Thiodiazotropha sp. (ex Lucinoma kastoroae)]|nr:glycosyltransferase family 2 protein [Candidatus Thiodiazotropha sp. (ex Lucinoma kastoroae)]